MKNGEGRKSDRRRLPGFKFFFCIIFLLGLGFGFFAGYHYVNGKLIERALSEEKHAAEVGAYADKVKASVTVTLQRIRSTKTNEDWKALADDSVNFLPKEKEAFGSAIRLKAFEADFWKAEQLLSRARTFLVDDQNHPVGKRYLDDAHALYKRNEELAANLAGGILDPLLRARAHYLIAVYYYRSLFFLDLRKDALKGADIAERVIAHSAKVFEVEKRDHDTQVLLEILQKNAKQYIAAKSGDMPDEARLRLLPRGEISVPGGGPQGRDQGRH